MGPGGISIWQLLIILVIVLLLFGTKKLGSIGSDLGRAIRGFKDSIGDKDEEADVSSIDEQTKASNTAEESK